MPGFVRFLLNLIFGGRTKSPKSVPIEEQKEKVEEIKTNPALIKSEPDVEPESQKEEKIDNKETTKKSKPMDIYNLSVEELEAAYEMLGYPVFRNESKEFNLNYCGVRSKERKPNAFDDMFYMWFYFEGKVRVFKHTGTTDPGTYWLENPINVEGTAILKPDFYGGAWKQGYHRGKYPALVQRLAVTVLRDDDKDNELDFDTTKEETGFFGINHHRSNPNYESKQVDKWSAGCQVRNNPEQYEEFWGLIVKAGENWGDAYSYGLVEEKSFEAI